VCNTFAGLAGTVADAGTTDLALAEALLPNVYAAKAVALDLLALFAPRVDTGTGGKPKQRCG
jgi:hypothetical protein